MRELRRPQSEADPALARGPTRRAEMPGNPSRQRHSQPATKAPCRDWHRSGALPRVVELRPASAGPWGAPIVQGHAEKLGQRTWGLKDGRPGLERRGPGPKRKGRGLRPLGTLRRHSGAPLPGPPVRLRPRARGRSGNSRADPETAERTRKRRAPSPASAGTRRLRGGDGGGCCAGGRGRGGPATAAGGW